MSVKIGFTGADSTGKSALIRKLTELFSRENKVKVLSIGDIARCSPYPLVEQQSIESSNWIFEKVKSCEFTSQNEADILICDRTVLDILIFSKLSAIKGFISQSALECFSSKVELWLKTYLMIFYCVINNSFAVSVSNVPNGNLGMREKFEEFLMSEIQTFNTETVFVKLPNTLQERIVVVKAALNCPKQARRTSYGRWGR